MFYTSNSVQKRVFSFQVVKIQSGEINLEVIYIYLDFCDVLEQNAQIIPKVHISVYHKHETVYVIRMYLCYNMYSIY